MEDENKNKEKELLELWLMVQERKGIDKLAGWLIELGVLTITVIINHHH